MIRNDILLLALLYEKVYSPIILRSIKYKGYNNDIPETIGLSSWDDVIDIELTPRYKVFILNTSKGKFPFKLGKTDTITEIKSPSGDMWARDNRGDLKKVN